MSHAKNKPLYVRQTRHARGAFPQFFNIVFVAFQSPNTRSSVYPVHLSSTCSVHHVVSNYNSSTKSSFKPRTPSLQTYRVHLDMQGGGGELLGSLPPAPDMLHSRSRTRGHRRTDSLLEALNPRPRPQPTYLPCMRAHSVTHHLPTS